MKANELTSKALMVGDFVMYNDEPCQVETIREYGEVRLSGWSESVYLDDNIKPIPITKELLEKNGFERENLITSYNHYTGIDNRVCLTNDFYSMNSRNMWTAHIDSEDYCTIAHCELTYVHELQHILRLYKIDKEIVV